VNARRARALSGLRVLVGPLALVAFFQPWLRGSGRFAGLTFSGYRLVGFTGRLEALDLGAVPFALLVVCRFLILGVAITAAWQVLLAPWWRSHRAYRASGWYLTLSAGLLAAVPSLAAGSVVLLAGPVLLLASAALFLGCEHGAFIVRHANGIWHRRRGRKHDLSARPSALSRQTAPGRAPGGER
jgi:hypothetical protein